MLRSSTTLFRRVPTRALATRAAELFVVGLGLGRTIFGAVPPNRGDRAWADGLVATAQTTIFGSSHLAQVSLHWLATRAFVPAAPTRAAAAMQIGARAIGVFYVVAVWLWARRLAGADRLVFLVVGTLATPVIVYFSGYQEIGFYSLPFALVGIFVASSHRASRRGSTLSFGVAGAAIAGIGAAFHGLGFFFLPAFVPKPPRSVARLPRWAGECVARAVAFFGPNGLAFLGYLLLFPGATITPGDAHGGKNGSLLLDFAYRRDGHYLLQGKAVFIALELLLLNAPAFFVAAAAAVVARPGPDVRSTRPLLVLGVAGLAFAVLFNPNPWWDAIYDFDMYAAALAPLHLACAFTAMRLVPARRPAGMLLRAALVLVSGAGTFVFHRWIHTRVLGVPGIAHPIPLVWYPTTAPLK